ncbi:MAG: hypothetical protein HQ534_05220 [Armatimonadetes bacterium]|nr:hypothetical protein [Armatimonadota bacterium]
MRYYNKEIIKKIKEYFSSNQTFTRKELYDFLEHNFFPNLKETTFRWRVYELKKNNIIISVTRGVFRLSENKATFVPNINNTLSKVSNLLQKNFNSISYCIWNSNWLNEFSRHQAANEIIFIEVEKELVNSVFSLLIDNNYKNVYIEPDKFVTETYVSENQISIIVKFLITKSPIQSVKNSTVPKLEKILVDLFSDNKYLVAYKGYEQKIIFVNAFDNYQLNLSNLINYSRRRKKDKIIIEFLIAEINIDEGLLK